MFWGEVGCGPSAHYLPEEINEWPYLFSKHAYMSIRIIVPVGVATSADSKNVPEMFHSFFGDGYTLFPPSPDALF